MSNTAEVIEPTFMWGDLDEQFNDPDQYELEDVLDSLVARQADEHGDLKEPCEEAQELLDQWQIDDEHDYLPDWRAAVARRAPRMESVPDNRLNDAEILGTEPDGFGDFLAREATFLLGELWGPRDRRNTQDGDWKSVGLPWGAWVGGQPGDKNSPAWGFSRHPVGKDKEGSSIVLGSSVGGARKAKAMDTMFAMGLDVDSGAKLDDVIEIIEEKGILCFVYTSFNHGKKGIELKRDEVLRKLQITRDPEEHEIRQFLREHDKNRYEESFIAGCTIKEQKHQTTEGVKIVLDTPPLEKFRLIFPLAEPVKLIDLADTQQAALDLWEDKITGLARNLLGVHFDTSCTDPSRLFYTARHPKGAEDWYAAVLMGNPLAFEDVEAMKKSMYTSKRDVNAFTMAGGNGDDRPPMAITPSGKSLNDWHTRYKDRFMLADLMETLCPDKIRHAGGEAQGHVHTECPFESEHTTEGGTATMAINCIDSQNEYWTWFCHHDACQSRHKLQFLEEALRQGWFEEDSLYDMDQGFVLEGEDDEEEAEEDEEPVLEGDQFKTPEQRAAEFTTSSTDEDIMKFIKKLFREGVDKSTQANVNAAIVKGTNLGKNDVKGFWKELEDAQRKRDRDREKDEKAEGGSVAVTNEWGFELLCEYGARRIHDTNREKPRVFHYGDALCVIREDSEGHARLAPLNKGGFEHHLNTVARFVRTMGESKDVIGVSAPDDVVRFLFNDDYSAYPDLRGLVTTPIFTKSGALLTEPGYDWSSQLFYKPDVTLSVPMVPKKPTEEQVKAALCLLIEELLADFRLDAVRREALVKAAEEGTINTPSVANALALLLLPFMREMIDGPTPGHLLNKRHPGSGSSYMVEVFGLLFQGDVPEAQELPERSEELSKVITTMVLEGRPYYFFDNVNETIGGAGLASAMTSGKYSARILGGNNSVRETLRGVWAFTGNNVVLTSEMVRRFSLVTFDPETANPEARTDFRHDELKDYVKENRGELVHACLTLIQNWVAQGRPNWSGQPMKSFQSWSKSVGGVLEASGVEGFLGNRAALKDMSENAEDPKDTLKTRLVEMAVAEGGSIYISTAEGEHDGKTVHSIVDILNDFYGSCEPLLILGWGYDKKAHDGAYTAERGRVGQRFFYDLVKPRDHIVGEFEMTVTESHKPKGCPKVYLIEVQEREEGTESAA